MATHSIHAIDSHTEGEPTRVLLDAGPVGASRTVAEWLRAWRGANDALEVPAQLRALVSEPRAAAATVGALWCPTSREDVSCGVIFFNSAGALGMCGHGTIGLAATLKRLGTLGSGEYRFETPVGDVTVRIGNDERVEVDNVPAFRHRSGVELRVGAALVRGDVAWGGNWFFVVEHDGAIDLEHSDELLVHTKAIQAALTRERVTGASDAVIDHVALFARSNSADADSRNFVLCPNGAYDRSPCGTGTCAKLACLAADRRLRAGDVWRQQSVTGSRFDAWYRDLGDGTIAPTIRGRAWITAKLTLYPDQ